MFFIILFTVLAASILLVWILGAPPKPGPTEATKPKSLLTDFVMRVMRLVNFPGPQNTDEIFEQIEKRAKGCAWKSPEEAQALRKPVDIICRLTRSPRMHPMGKFLFRQLMITRLVERRQVWQCHRDHPELSKIPIKQPIFILGFPRAGSTFLFNLLAKDPDSRFLTLWEQMDSEYKPNDKAHSDALRAKAVSIQSKMRFIFNNVHKELQHKHKLDVETPEECQILLQKGLMFTQIADQEEFRAWFTDHDAYDDYLLHKANVQLIDANRPKKHTHWVFKAPAHTHHLASLLKVYPDARVILTQRHPEKTAGSLASLRTTMQQLIWDPIDVSGCNRNIALRFLPLAFENTRKVVESSKNPDQFFRCHFDDLVADPVSMVKSIYDHFGVEFTDRYAKVLEDFVKPDQARQKKEVKHHYTTEQFNLTDEDVNEAYANYIKFVGEKQQLKKK